MEVVWQITPIPLYPSGPQGLIHGLSSSWPIHLLHQSADFCRGPNIAARNMRGCKVSDCGGDYQSGREDALWPPLDPLEMSSVWLAGCLAFQFAGWCHSHFTSVFAESKEKQFHTVNRFHVQLLNDINEQLVTRSLLLLNTNTEQHQREWPAEIKRIFCAFTFSCLL